MKYLIGISLAATTAVGVVQPAVAGSAYDAVIASKAAQLGVPVALVHRVIVRESRYQAGLVSHGNIGLMQIKLATARSLGYGGNAEGLLDPETNLTWGIRYLAGAYHTADGNYERAIHYYAAGYYYAAKRYHRGAMNANVVIAPAPTAQEPVAATRPKP